LHAGPIAPIFKELTAAFGRLAFST